MQAGGGASSGQQKQNNEQILTKKRLQDLVQQVDPSVQLEDDAEEVLLQIGDDFIESIVASACQIAKHRKSNTVDAKDLQLHLEHSLNMFIPGFGTEDVKPKKSATTESHRQRMALIKKTLKK